MKRDAMVDWMNELLEIERFADYCPNGLQIEGTEEVDKVALGVSLHLPLVEAAVEWGADVLLVHHGMFWKNEPRPLVGHRRARVKALLDAGVNLVAYHLPLDAHPQVGNNAVIADWLDVPKDAREPFDEGGIGVLGRYPAPVARDVLREALVEAFGKERPLFFEHGPAEIDTVAICSGGGAGYFADARAAGAQLFITGEAREASMGEAMDVGANFVAAGHYATERGGVWALGARLETEFGVETEFFAFDNPV